MRVRHFCNTPTRVHPSSLLQDNGGYGRGVAIPTYVTLTPTLPQASKNLENPSRTLSPPQPKHAPRTQNIPPQGPIAEHPPELYGVRLRFPTRAPDGSSIPSRNFVVIEGAGWFSEPKTLAVGEITVDIVKIGPDRYKATGLEFADELEEIEGLITVEDGRSVSINIPLHTIILHPKEAERSHSSDDDNRLIA